MRSKAVAAVLLGALVVDPVGALAQGQNANPAVRTDEDRASGVPQPGSNSFTEGQARSRMEDAGFKDVADLVKDDQGIWRGRAMRNGAPTGVALDYKGDVFGSAATATPAPGGATAGPNGVPRDGTPSDPPGTAAGRTVDNALGTDTTGANPNGSRPDGAPGNPPGTAIGRAVDRAQGETPRPDGAPGNPSGTAAGRAVDRALGTNGTGANPGAGGSAR